MCCMHLLGTSLSIKPAHLQASGLGVTPQHSPRRSIQGIWNTGYSWRLKFPLKYFPIETVLHQIILCQHSVVSCCSVYHHTLSGSHEAKEKSMIRCGPKDIPIGAPTLNPLIEDTFPKAYSTACYFNSWNRSTFLPHPYPNKKSPSNCFGYSLLQPKPGQKYCYGSPEKSEPIALSSPGSKIVNSLSFSPFSWKQILHRDILLKAPCLEACSDSPSPQQIWVFQVRDGR